jgi:hypothetical protein
MIILFTMLFFIFTEKNWHLYVIDHPYEGIYRCACIQKIEIPHIPSFCKYATNNDNTTNLINLYKLLYVLFVSI